MWFGVLSIAPLIFGGSQVRKDFLEAVTTF